MPLISIVELATCNGQARFLILDGLIQSDPDLPGCSGERVLPGKTGSNTVNFLYRGKFIIPVNRGSGKLGSNCIRQKTEILKLDFECKWSSKTTKVMNVC